MLGLLDATHLLQLCVGQLQRDRRTEASAWGRTLPFSEAASAPPPPSQHRDGRPWGQAGTATCSFPAGGMGLGTTLQGVSVLPSSVGRGWGHTAPLSLLHERMPALPPKCCTSQFHPHAAPSRGSPPLPCREDPNSHRQPLAEELRTSPCSGTRSWGSPGLLHTRLQRETCRMTGGGEFQRQGTRCRDTAAHSSRRGRTGGGRPHSTAELSSSSGTHGLSPTPGSSAALRWGGGLAVPPERGRRRSPAGCSAFCPSLRNVRRLRAGRDGCRGRAP